MVRRKCQRNKNEVCNRRRGSRMADELKNALEKAAEEQPDGALSARVKKLLARKKNLQRKKRAKLPPKLRK